MFGAGTAAQFDPPVDELVDCHAVSCAQRSTCNRRILAALNAINPAIADRMSRQNDLNHHLREIQVATQDRLRSFWAPTCETLLADEQPKSSAAWSAIKRFFGRTAAPVTSHRALPLLARPFSDPDAWRELLSDRWAGWQSLHDRRLSRIELHIVDVSLAGYVRACSDQGMVLGRIEEGALILQRSEGLSARTRLKLWMSAPHFRDLEGVVLRETDPGVEVIAGLVWLSRALELPGSVPASDYGCFDRDLQEDRADKRMNLLQNKLDETAKELEALKKQVDEMRRTTGGGGTRR